MKKSIAILIFIGALVAIVAETTPIHNRVFGLEAQSDPSLAVEIIKNDSTAWAIAKIGMTVGTVLMSIGIIQHNRGFREISEIQTTLIVSNLGTIMLILGTLLFSVINYYNITQPPEAYLNGFNVPDGMFSTYTLFTRFASVLLGYVFIQSGYSKKLGWFMLVISGLFLVLMGSDGPPAINTLVFLVMGFALLFKPSATP